MTSKKIIAVVGATGAQGGGLARAILADSDGPFSVRALTRDPESTAAKALAALGAEVVEADLNDEPSLAAAFDGAHGVFVVTNYWAELTDEEEAAQSRPQRELAQAAAAAEAAKVAGVEHVVWSTFEDTRHFFGTGEDKAPTVEGSYKVPHFDAKAEANALFTERGVPTTFLLTTFYFDGFSSGQFLTRENGKLGVTLPIADGRMSGVVAEDIGKTALGIFKRGDEFVDKSVGVAGGHLTGVEFAEALTEALGEEVEYRPFTWDEYRAFESPVAIEVSNMFQYYAENEAEFTGARNIALVRELNPTLQTFRDWLSNNKHSIPRA